MNRETFAKSSQHTTNETAYYLSNYQNDEKAVRWTVRALTPAFKAISRLNNHKLIELEKRLELLINAKAKED
jgi:hypothetical protein